MKIAVVSVSTHAYKNNKIFTPLGKTVKMEGLSISRQDSNSGFTKLKELFDEENININTYDLFDKNDNIDIEFHINGSFSKKTNASKLYCIHPEIYLVDKKCDPKILEKKYDRIFTNIKKDIDNNRFIDLQVPQGYKKTKIEKIERPKLACIVASNKNLNRNYSKSGYVMRTKLIKWANKHSENLDVYGPDWNLFFSSNYYANRFLKFFQKKLNFNIKRKGIFKGVCLNKVETMSHYKFSFCFENVYDIDGYFTQGLFDSLKNGCVPIYLGPKNVNEYIPKNCLIDFRKFSDFKSIFEYLKNMSSNEYFEFIDNINNFLFSEQYKEFSPENFAKKILDQVKSEKF